VLDFKGENCAVTARARRELGQEVVLIDRSV
jgi:type IV secretory pathway TraG/TraD family ATPase VirD4